MGMKLAGIMALVTVLTGGAFYWYYADTQAKMAILNENNAKLGIAIQISEDTIDQLQVDYDDASESLIQLNDEFVAIRRQNQPLADKLDKNDIGYLASNKPVLIERIINIATDRANRCFELLSGAELTDTEKESSDGKAFNSECPWLFDRYNTD